MPALPHDDGSHRTRRTLVLATLLLASVLAMAVLVQHTPWAGPALANGLRSVLGAHRVTRLEEFWADVEDRALRLTARRTPPRSLHDASPAIAPLPDRAPPSPAPEFAREPESPLAGHRSQLHRAELEPPARPGDVPPPFPEVAAEDDGRWFPVPDPEHPTSTPAAYRTLLHPDPARNFAELFVVALPLAGIELRLVTGTEEPESDNPEVQHLESRGLIAPSDDRQLLFAFNGGFKTQHGHHGMIVSGVTVVPLRVGLCTIVGPASAAPRIASWRPTDEVEAGAWYRQTPPCMLEDGVLHPGLVKPETRAWGATLDGETVIRRSAIALNRARDTLYVGVSNYTTARALALGMQSAGGWSVAQLDVNWSYPKFLIFPRDAAGVRQAVSLFQGFLFERDEMLRQASPRDFFYVIRADAAQ